MRSNARALGTSVFVVLPRAFLSGLSCEDGKGIDEWCGSEMRLCARFEYLERVALVDISASDGVTTRFGVSQASKDRWRKAEVVTRKPWIDGRSA